MCHNYADHRNCLLLVRQHQVSAGKTLLGLLEKPGTLESQAQFPTIHVAATHAVHRDLTCRVLPYLEDSVWYLQLVR